MLTVPILSEIEPGRVWTVETLPTVAEVRSASRNDPKAGYWRGNYHVTRYQGNKRNDFKPEQWLLNRFFEDYTNAHGEEVKGIRSSRDIVQQITGAAAPWTFPSQARLLIKWLCIGQSRSSMNKAILPEWHYQYCLPFISEQAAMFDLDAAYWQMAERMKSPVFDFIDGRIIWRSLTSQQAERWQTLLDLLRPYKLLRLAIVGACAAGWNRSRENWHGSDSFRAGEQSKQGDFPSPLQALALLAVRMTYEVTQVQSDIAKSLYTNADAVTSETVSSMEYWDEYGLKYKCKAKGAAVVHAVGAWKIGDKQTQTYPVFSSLNRFDPHTQPFRITDAFLHTQVLAKRA